jgi:hypothetical protein
MEKDEVINRLKNWHSGNPRIPGYFYENYEIALLAVTNSWTALDYIPKKYITKRLCEIAVERFWMAIDHMPEEYKSIELRLKAIIKGGTVAWTDFPEGQKSREYYTLAVDIDGFVLQFIPEEYITEEMCYLAIKNYGMEVIEKNVIPEKYRTNKLIILAQQIDKIKDKIKKHRHIFEYETEFTKLIDSIDKTLIDKIFKNMDLEQLATAMKKTTEETREKIFDNINGKTKEKLKEIFYDIGPQELLDVYEAQRNVNNKVNERLKSMSNP